MQYEAFEIVELQIDERERMGMRWGVIPDRDSVGYFSASLHLAD